MRQLQIDILDEYSEEAEEILEKYSSDISSSEVEKNDDAFVEFSTTIDQKEIDQITEELKDLEVGSGDLSIRVIDQESLIEKGVKTRGPSKGILSSQEIYSKAQKASGFNRAQWGMTALSGALAAIGLSTSNIIVLLGSILLAPVLYPLAALSISIKQGDNSMAFKSAKTSLLSISSIFIFSIPIFLVFGGSGMNVLLEGFELVILSSIVGSAAMLTFISEYKEEMAGAALAVAIVPPAALAGNAVSSLNALQFTHSLIVLTVNILTVIISGYAILTALGTKPLTKYKKEHAKELRILFISMTVFLILILLMEL